ncbi:hypothetical protein BC833DRAFT_651357 [Globomyces pollinis-pini]|nr:hypothetical protein BC833DRAFT_651357 [Globomyces pollinis-pini]
MNQEISYYLGFDCSTQSMKYTLIDHQLNIIAHHQIKYDTLPFNTQNGIMISTLDPNDITTPVLVFIASLDYLLSHLKQHYGDLCPWIKGISCSGQQHGSVYFKNGSRSILNHLNVEFSLLDQLSDIFTVSQTPIWMNSSTTKQCRDFEYQFGGAELLCKSTGSRAHERFTIHHILKLIQTCPDVYHNTERITLISNFLSTLLVGDYTPIDISDGSGMNFMNIETGKWDPIGIDIINQYGKLFSFSLVIDSSHSIVDKLGVELVPCHTIVGTLSSYYIKRYNFNSDCKIISSSGDNPCTLVGFKIKQDTELCISLGTSTTILGIMKTLPSTLLLNTHVLKSPLNEFEYMVMLCFKNGGLSRDLMNQEYFQGDWTLFCKCLEQSSVGNDGYIGFWYHYPELLPYTQQSILKKFDGDDQVIERFPDIKYECRGIIESQCFGIRKYSRQLGMKPKSILVTGGGSKNQSILEILCNVMDCKVYVWSIVFDARN